MTVDLTPKHEQFLREKVASGAYANEAEVLAEALDLLEWRDNERRLALLKALDEGEEDIRAGRTVSLRTPEEIDAYFKLS